MVRTKLIRFIRKHATGVAPTELHTVQVERGMIWQEAIDKFVRIQLQILCVLNSSLSIRYADVVGDKEGFYLSQQIRNGKQTVILACEVELSAAAAKKAKETKAKKEIMFQVYRANTGLQFRNESLAELEKKYKKVESEEAEQHWTQQYDASVNTCSHAYWRGNCRNISMGQDCEVSSCTLCSAIYCNILSFRLD